MIQNQVYHFLVFLLIPFQLQDAGSSQEEEDDDEELGNCRGAPLMRMFAQVFHQQGKAPF